jgi:hypothetical protein
MDERVGGELPDFAALPDERAVERQMSEHVGAAEKAGDDGGERMHRHEQRRDMHRVAADPGHRLVVIRGGDTEHASIKCAPASRARDVVGGFWETTSGLTQTPGS